MKVNEEIAKALLTVDNEALGAAFKGALAIYTGYKKTDEYYEKCTCARDESYLSMVLLLETIFKEDKKK